MEALQSELTECAQQALSAPKPALSPSIEVFAKGLKHLHLVEKSQACWRTVR